MEKMKMNFLGVIFLTLLLTEAAETLNKYYAEDLCLKKPIATIELHRYSSVVLTSTSLRNVRSCEILVKPKRGASVVLSIKSYNLNSSDQLIIEDSDYHKVRLLGRSEFFDERKSIISEGPIHVYFTPDPDNPEEKTHFEFVLTETHEGSCGHGEYECRNKECIPSSLVCDGHNHCGDRSDQVKCGRRNDGSSTEYERRGSSAASVWVISIVVGGILLVIVVTVFLAIMIRGIVKKKEEQAARVSVQTVETTIPPHPPTPSNTQSQPSYLVQIRNSFRSGRNSKVMGSIPVSEDHQMSDRFQVPTMYPHIPIPTSLPL